MNQFRYYSIQQLVYLYLMSSYLYYICDKSYMLDEEFDALCRYLLDNFSEVRKVKLSPLLTEDRLREGTGYHLAEKDYPKSLRMAAHYNYSITEKKRETWEMLMLPQFAERFV